MSRTTTRALAIAALVCSPLGAQTWQTIGTPDNSNTGAYWNNRSDGTSGDLVCNIGAVLTNTSPVPIAQCPNQSPTGFLPLTPTPLTRSNRFLGGANGAEPGVGGFRFAAGTYTISLIGRIAAHDEIWGVIQDDGTVYSAEQLAAGSTVLTGPFAIWIYQAEPIANEGTRYTSDRRIGLTAIGSRAATINQQFAVFTNGTGVGNLGGLSADAFGTIIDATGFGATYYVGMGDNVNGGRGFGPGDGINSVADRDYNDIIIRIQSVPEPATFALFGAGVVALLGIARRRQTQA